MLSTLRTALPYIVALALYFPLLFHHDFAPWAPYAGAAFLAMTALICAGIKGWPRLRSWIIARYTPKRLPDVVQRREDAHDALLPIGHELAERLLLHHPNLPWNGTLYLVVSSRGHHMVVGIPDPAKHNDTLKTHVEIAPTQLRALLRPHFRDLWPWDWWLFLQALDGQVAVRTVLRYTAHQRLALHTSTIEARLCTP